MRILASLLALTVLLGTQVSSAMTLPPNNFHIYDRVNRIANITEEQFNQIIDTIAAHWAPIAKLHGAELVVEKRWNDGTVNAYASQSGNKWKISMFGGLARRPEVTPDGFALVVCHELGHHFGGYYFYGNSDWASAEGQADYFATQVCGKKVWAFSRFNRIYSQGVPQVVKEKCDLAWKDQPLRDLCYRQAYGGMSLATLLAALGGSPAPKFETPDPTKVTKSQTAHPRAQCRLDTYFAGAVCNKNFDIRVIPAKGLPGGQNTLEGEKIAAEHSCTEAAGFQMGNRPNCWFKPLITQRLHRRP